RRGESESAQRHTDREQQESGSEQEVRDTKWPAALCVEREAQPEERHQVEDVTLLDLVRAEEGSAARSVRLAQTRLGEEGDREEDDKDAERSLDVGSGSTENEPEAEEASRDDDPAGCVRQHHRVPTDPAQVADWVEVEVQDRVVVAEGPAGAGQHQCRG